MKKKISVIGVSTIFTVLVLVQASMVYAAPVYIAGFGSNEFPAYPYNTSAYLGTVFPDDGAYVGCGPTTGAMIMGYFQHHFGLTGLLTSPTPAGVDEGLATAWALHSSSYMDTNTAHDEAADPTKINGFGSVYNIKPGLEDYADDRGFEVKVMAHAATDAPIADPTYWYNDYGPYGVAWTNDGIFWLHPGGVWDIDPDLFCDFVDAKLSSGIAVFLTVDSDNVEGGDHWIPCVGYDKATGMYYYYDTHDTALHSALIAYYESTPVAGDYAISFVRTVEYIAPPPTAASIESSDAAGNKKDQFDISDTVYVYGSGYDVDLEYDIYVVADSTWTDGMSFPTRIAGTATTVTSDASGNIPAGTQVWGSSLTPGKYDIVVDVNDNGHYDADTDALDDNDIQITAGFLVIPQVPLGTLMAFGAMIIGFVCYYAFPRISKKK